VKKESNKVIKVEAKIDGKVYIIKGNASEEHIKAVAEYVDKKIKMITKNRPNLSRSKATVLAALNITDELFRLNREYEELLNLLDEGDSNS